MYNEILSPGEKVKRIRRILRINQSALAGNDISRVLISQIERGVTGLTYHTAQVIVKNASKIIKQKGIEVSITVEDLMEDIEEQIEKKFDIALYKLKELFVLKDSYNRFIEQCKEIEHLLKRYPCLKERREAWFEVCINYFHMTQQEDRLEEYMVYYFMLTVEKQDYKKMLELLQRQMDFYLACKKYEWVVKLGKWALLIEQNHPIIDFNLKEIYLTLAFAYEKKKDFAPCRSTLNELKRRWELSEIETIEVRLLEVLCCFQGKEYKKAEQLCKEVLVFATNYKLPDKIMKAYCNLGQIYLRLGQLESARENIDKALNIVGAGDILSINENYKWALSIYIKLDMEEEVEKIFKKALPIVMKSQDICTQVDMLRELCDFYIIHDKGQKLMKLVETTEILIFRHSLRDRSILDIFIKAQNYFLKADNNIRERILVKELNIINYFKNTEEQFV